MDTQQNRLFHALQIGVASPKQIRTWADRFLPNGETVGEVSSWETVNYKTLKPEPNGLFCQKIFGPVVDFTCACGKKAHKVQIGFCSKCGVERTGSRVRRYRLGYIHLKQPVVNPLYATHRPSPVSLCVGWNNKRLQAVSNSVEFCYLPLVFTRFASDMDFYSLFPVPKGRRRVLDSLTPPTGSSAKPPCTPRLFASKKAAPNGARRYPPQSLSQGLAGLLYGVAYDCTWRQVEDLQEFLYFMSEHSFQYEWTIPYYSLTRRVPQFNQEIPFHPNPYPLQTGGLAFQHILAHFELRELLQQLKLQHYELKRIIFYIHERLPTFGVKGPVKLKLVKGLNKLKELEKTCLRRVQVIRDFSQSSTQPAWMMLSYLPVLPPGLRPISSIRGELIISDINTLYRKVLIRNKRIDTDKGFGVFDTALSGSWSSWCYNLRQVQEAVESLLKKGSLESGKPIKSLLDVLKGKKGRFRQHLLGKRVDYSGRSVIVVGPHLKIHECGLPKQMAIELFQPFLIQQLRKKGIVFTTSAAKTLIAERRPIVWVLLKEMLKNHPILLNRAPTLHRLGIQAFLPQLVEGKAIVLHPLVCPAFNADFDGDQMAVHVPLSVQARAEAFNLLWARNHVLAPSSGQPLLLPTQDMVLGFYYLTCSLERPPKALESVIPMKHTVAHTRHQESVKGNMTTPYFADFMTVKKSFDRGVLGFQSPIWVQWAGDLYSGGSAAHLSSLETRLTVSGQQERVCADTAETSCATSSRSVRYIRTTVGRVLMHQWIYEPTKPRP